MSVLTYVIYAVEECLNLCNICIRGNHYNLLYVYIYAKRECGKLLYACCENTVTDYIDVCA